MSVLTAEMSGWPWSDDDSLLVYQAGVEGALSRGARRETAEDIGSIVLIRIRIKYEFYPLNERCLLARTCGAYEYISQIRKYRNEVSSGECDEELERMRVGKDLRPQCDESNEMYLFAFSMGKARSYLATLKEISCPLCRADRVTCPNLDQLKKIAYHYCKERLSGETNFAIVNERAVRQAAVAMGASPDILNSSKTAAKEWAKRSIVCSAYVVHATLNYATDVSTSQLVTTAAVRSRSRLQTKWAVPYDQAMKDFDENWKP